MKKGDTASCDLAPLPNTVNQAGPVFEHGLPPTPRKMDSQVRGNAICQETVLCVVQYRTYQSFIIIDRVQFLRKLARGHLPHTDRSLHWRCPAPRFSHVEGR